MTEKEIPATELMTQHRRGFIVITHLGEENAYWTDPWTGEEFFSKLLPDAELDS